MAQAPGLRWPARQVGDVGDLPHVAGAEHGYTTGFRYEVRGISALRVAGLRGLIAVRIGHPMD